MKKVLLALIPLLLIVSPVILNSSLLPEGKKKKELNLEKERLISELSNLNNEIDKAGALSTVQKEAEKLGMKPGKIQRLSAPPVALAPQP